jgi:pimeloyl-ACP methyl ester carboxylesterase
MFVFLIHGAWSTRNSFNFIEDNLPHNTKTLSYCYDGTTSSLQQIIDGANKALNKETEDCVVIGHSLGGLIAINLHDNEKVSKIITLAAPLSGIEIPVVFKPFVYYNTPLLQQISPQSRFIKQIHDGRYTKSITCCFATRGYNPLINERSDGLITLATQQQWTPPYSLQYDIECNHYEILQNRTVVEIIKRQLK